MQVVYTNATTLPVVNETYTAQVAGVLQKIGGFGTGGPSDSGVYMPITQAESFFGTNQADYIIVQLKNSDNATITSVSKAITDYFGGQVTSNIFHGCVELAFNNFHHYPVLPRRNCSNFTSSCRSWNYEYNDCFAN